MAELEEWRARQALSEIIGSNYGECQCHESTMIAAAEALKMQIPEQVKIEDWSPAKCPTCKEYLSEHLGDGYYKHFDHLERCPKCGRKLKW